MKKLSLVIAALAMVLGITQCKKQENPVGGKLITQKVTFTTSFGDSSKLDVTETGGTLGLKWQIGDEITVTDGAGHSKTLTCTFVSPDGLTGTFTGEIVYETGKLTFTVGTEPKYMNQHFTSITKDQIYLVGESKFELSGDYGEIPMELPYAILKVDLSELATAEPTDVSVKIGGKEVATVTNVSNVSESDCQVYLLLPLTVTGPTDTILTFDNNKGKIITHTYTLAPNGFYTGGGTGGMALILPDGALSGLFTINGAGKQVYFSKGNLQYLPTSKTWQFATNQYDLLDNTSTVSPSAAKQIV